MARAKKNLGEAQNPFMPANINYKYFIIYICSGLYQGISMTTEGCRLSEENGLYNEVNEYERIRTDNKEDYAQLDNEVPMYETVESDSRAGIDNNIIADDKNLDGLMYETIEG